MWKDYSIGFIKKNRASSVSVLVAAFISALFLSLLCGLFYNFWNYEIESVVLEEGNWQGRISGAFEEDKVSEIENFANVKTAIINEDLSDDQTLVVDICFDNMRAVYQDMPLIAQQLGVPETSVSYHESLLSSYFINDPQDSNPPLLMAFYLFVLLLVSVSLILIIHNSFAVSMNARVHQFGIFSSIGATPGQIRTCLLQEAAMLCVIPVLIGSFVGIALTFGAIQAVNILADSIVGRHGRITAKTEKKVPYSCAFIWNRRGTCRECTESTEEISANRHAVVDPFFFGLRPYAEFFYSLWNQYKPYLI